MEAICDDTKPNATWIADDGRLAFTMKTEEHVQRLNPLQGLHVQKEVVPFCLCCNMQTFLAGCGPGDLLRSFKPTFFLQTIREVLRTLGCNAGASGLTLKSWRAGRAYALVNFGAHIGEILQAGEWKSVLFLRYSQPESIDSNVLALGRLLEAAMDMSDKYDEGDK